jgi:hypothetical protein
MKCKYRGFEIDVTRDESLGGDEFLYFSIFRISDGYEIESSFSSGSEKVREFIDYMKKRIDKTLIENPDMALAGVEVDDEEVYIY